MCRGATHGHRGAAARRRSPLRGGRPRAARTVPLSIAQLSQLSQLSQLQLRRNATAAMTHSNT